MDIIRFENFDLVVTYYETNSRNVFAHCNSYSIDQLLQWDTYL